MRKIIRFSFVLPVIGLFLITGMPEKAIGQTDTEFWFAAPHVTKDHGWENNNNFFFMRFASMHLAANVTITMPANPDFEPVEFLLPPNTAHTVEFTDIIEGMWNFPPSKVNNRGIHVEATNLITAYFEVGTLNNPDIFSLKGRNALGKDFFVPFQNFFRNGNYTPEQPYSKIDIVATLDNTTVTIIPTKPAHLNQPAGDSIVVVLNKGQTYGIAPNQIQSGGFPRQGQLPANRLSGTKVVSDKPVAVTSSDDSVDAHPENTCKDLIGDQLIPVDIIGTEYIAMRGRLTIPEFFYVVATRDDTDIYVDGIFRDNIGEGQVFRFQINNQTHHILTSKPSYVYHVAGFGCEMGGAVLPPVNVCTGSTQVSFTRSKGESFFLNILVRAGAEDGFIFNGDGPNTIISEDVFQPVQGTTTWLAAEFEFDEDLIPIAEARLLQNIKDVFHLGIINGGEDTGTMYGYFSDFHQLQATSLIADANTDLEAFCYGQPVQLIATGGTNYSWSPPDFLDDPFSPTPIAIPDQSISYVVTVSGACDMVDSASVTVQVADPLHALFTVSSTSGCSPFDLSVFNHSIGVENFSWKFGDGLTSGLDFEEFNHTYVNDTDSVQTFKVSLVGRNDLFCIDSMSTVITVYPEVRSVAGASDLSGCAPLKVDFSNYSTGAEGYHWRFGDGGTSPLHSPVHTFDNYTDSEITYQVILKATNKFGCYDYDTLSVAVQPFIKAGFEFDPPVHCSPYELAVTNSSVGAVTHIWDFDNGQQPQYFDDDFVYLFENNTQEPLIFNISQAVANDYGCRDTLERSLTVYPYIESVFTASVSEGCNPLEVSFENLSEGEDTWYWDFGPGQGSSTEHSPVYEFVNPDPDNPLTLDVQLYTVSAFGCRDTSTTQITVFPRLEADFGFDYSEACAPDEFTFTNLSVGGTTYVWDFGDGSPQVVSSSPQVSHTFESPEGGPAVYNVSLTALTDNCSEQKVRQVTIYPEVTADFSPITQGCHPLEVEFENNSTGAVKYYWNFGDGGSSTLTHPTRTFYNYSHFQVDTFYVELIAESPSLCRDTLSLPVVVFPRPRAMFDMPWDAGCAPFEVSLIDNSIGNTSNTWDFDDGHLESDYPGNKHHLYLNNNSGPVVYQPLLTVTNEYECTDTVSRTLTVYPQVEAKVSLSQQQGCHPLEVVIYNNTSGADASMPYYWDYGDGNTSSVAGESHMHVFNNFSNTGSSVYSTTLVAYSIYGCKDSLEIPVEVYARPRAMFSAPDEPSCSPFDVQFTDLSLGGSQGSYIWDFGNGSYSETHGSTSHIFYQPAGSGIGWFPVTLTIENEHGCDDTYISNVGVFPSVEASFSSQQQGCHPLDVQFTNTTQGATAFQWDFDDDSSSNQFSPQHVFFNNSHTQTHTYQVHLEAENEFGCSGSSWKDITVFPVPKADFSLDTYQGCSPLEVNITSNTQGSSLYQWTMGDEPTGNSSGHFVWTFQNLTDSVKQIPVLLDVSNQWGCSKSFSQSVEVFPEVVADFSTPGGEFQGCTPLGLPFENLSQRADQFTWTFGDGTQSTGINPEHWFFAPGSQPLEYLVTLAVQSAYGCKDTTMQQVVVHPRPVADFAASPYDQRYPSTTVDLENLSLPGQWQYTWHMGDGYSVTTDTDTVQLSHTYVWQSDDLTTKYYTIRLEVENSWCRDEVSRQVVIRAPDPVVYFTPQSQGCPPFEVQFTNHSQYALAHFWDFDDGNYSDEKNPVHTFWDPGVYNVKLVVSGDGGMDSTYQVITVHHPPVASFRVEPSLVTLPFEAVQMVNLSSLGNTYHWDFGDGNQSYDFSPSHIYQRAGTYDISLTVGSGTTPVCYDTMVLPGAAEARDECSMYFPNAFMPSTDGPSGGHYVTGDPLNQVFYPVYAGLEQYRLEIFNRWGELIFRTEDLDVGWDGYLRGTLSKMDVYVWKAWGRCYSGEEIKQAGDVTLYR